MLSMAEARGILPGEDVGYVNLATALAGTVEDAFEDEFWHDAISRKMKPMSMTMDMCSCLWANILRGLLRRALD